jgi:NADP-dependent 3-hydroxy acid dehydrogenase YdfG
MDSVVRGKVVVITGAGTGIGAACARDLAGAGARVVLVGRRAGLLDGQVATITAAGGEAWALPADVREWGQVESIVAQTVACHGRLDVFIANAAMFDQGPIDRADPGLWKALIETNVLGVLYAVRAVLPQMYEQGSGHIVIMNSGSGRKTYVGQPAYVTSKHATVAFADCLRQEVAPRGIRVSLIEPGAVDTPALQLLAGGDVGSVDDLILGVTPLDPADVARAVRFVLEQPPNVNVFEVLLRPTNQLL